MTQNFALRSAEEARTHEMLWGFLNKSGAQHGWEVYAVAQALKAMWTAALPVGKIAAVASAMSGQAVSEEVAATVLTKMTRSKVLRSRMNHGVRLYELNY